jgi:hypothetical protein
MIKKMKEIKFRAWDKSDKMMKYSKSYDGLGTFFNLIELREEANVQYELMQYTGLKDKNGKEIYENDLIDDGCGKVFLVESITPLQQSMYFSYENYDDFMSNSDIDYEIAGNIHENPELLESND